MMRVLKRLLGLTLVRVGQTPAGRAPKCPPPGVETTLVRAVDVREIAREYSDLEVSPDFLDRAERDGYQCCLTRLNGEVTGYGWVARGRCLHTPAVDVLIGSGQRYSFKAYTRPKFRGQHLRGSFGALDRFDAEHGIAQSVFFIETHNVASIRASRRNGSLFCGYAGYLELFGRVWTFRTGGAKRIDFSFVAAENSPADGVGSGPDS